MLLPIPKSCWSQEGTVSNITNTTKSITESKADECVMVFFLVQHFKSGNSYNGYLVFFEHFACVPPLLQPGQQLFGARTQRNPICTSECTAVQQSNSPLAAAQGNPDPGFQEIQAHFPRDGRAFPTRCFVLQGVRSHCTYSHGEMGILCNPKQHRAWWVSAIRKFKYLPSLP